MMHAQITNKIYIFTISATTTTTIITAVKIYEEKQFICKLSEFVFFQHSFAECVAKSSDKNTVSLKIYLFPDMFHGIFWFFFSFSAFN